MKPTVSGVSQECRQALLLLSYQLAHPTLALFQPIQSTSTSPACLPATALTISHWYSLPPTLFCIPTKLMAPSARKPAWVVPAFSPLLLCFWVWAGGPVGASVWMPHLTPVFHKGQRLCIGLTQFRSSPSGRLTSGQSLDFSEPRVPHAYTGHLKSALHCLW